MMQDERLEERRGEQLIGIGEYEKQPGNRKGSGGHF